MAHRIEWSDLQARLRVDLDALDRRVRGLLDHLGVAEADLSIVLVDDFAIAEVNRRSLGHEGPTDVISFPSDDGTTGTIAGELLISCETAAREARRLGVAPIDELTLYIVHGLLHLAGEDDLEPAPAARMRAREAELLRAIGVAPPPRDDG